MKFQYRKLTRKERKGSKYKYEVTGLYSHTVDIGSSILSVRGYLYYSAQYKTLWIYKGYRWDGSTGVLDVKSCRRGSLVHDALCQLINEGLLDRKYRKYADQLYRDMCIEDGMWKWHAGLRYFGLRLWAAIKKLNPLVKG